MRNAIAFVRTYPREASIWALGLIALALAEPQHGHVTICPLANLGLDFCPGCGLGRSISHIFRGEWLASFNAHPLGIFAVIVLSLRIISLSKQHFHSYGKNYRRPS